MITLCFNNLGDSVTKARIAPPELIGIKFPECTFIDNLQGSQIRIKSCFEHLFNDAEEIVCSHNQIWWAIGQNVFLGQKGGTSPLGSLALALCHVLENSPEGV